jgi:hypothetical protein
MKCGFCDREIPATAMKDGCGGCPMPGGCKKVCCPWCGYENPAVPEFLQRWAASKDKKGEDK